MAPVGVPQTFLTEEAEGPCFILSRVTAEAKYANVCYLRPRLSVSSLMVWLDPDQERLLSQIVGLDPGPVPEPAQAHVSSRSVHGHLVGQTQLSSDS